MRINDRHGLLMGSAVLAAIGAVLRDQIRDTDLAVRYGGDEFVVVLPHATLEEGHHFAERTLEQIRTVRPLGLADDLHVTVSIGVAALARGSSRRLEELLGDADTAAYTAKRMGGDSVQIFNH
jgi:diguanylate cyclase (GGDEF)-like protein